MRACAQEQGNAGKSITSSDKTPRKPSCLDMRPYRSSRVGRSRAPRSVLCWCSRLCQARAVGMSRQGLNWGQLQGQWQSRMSLRMFAVRETLRHCCIPWAVQVRTQRHFQCWFCTYKATPLENSSRENSENR